MAMNTRTNTKTREPVVDALEVDELFTNPPLNAAAAVPLDPAVGQLDGKLSTHDLTESAAESVSRLLIRVVPLVYGGLLGHLADRLVLGLLFGAVAASVLDLSMGDSSLLRRPASALRRRARAHWQGLFGLR